MRRMIGWLRRSEHRMLFWINRRPSENKLHKLIGSWLTTVTHMGGATFTLTTALLCALLAPTPWQTTGWQSFTAIIVSHLPVAIVKRAIKRLRPYQALPSVNTGRQLLRDGSFPSGHTTAIFAWMTPIVLTSGLLLSIIIPIALFIGFSVGLSRIYLGMHYPSDVAVGAVVGTLAGTAVNFFWALPAVS